MGSLDLFRNPRYIWALSDPPLSYILRHFAISLFEELVHHYSLITNYHKKEFYNKDEERMVNYPEEKRNGSPFLSDQMSQ